MADSRHSAIAPSGKNGLIPEIVATASYRLARINAQLAAIDELLLLCSRNEKQEEEMADATAALKSAERRAKAQLEVEADALTHQIRDLQHTHKEALARLEELRSRCHACEERANGMSSGRPNEADSARIAAAVSAATFSQDAAIATISHECDVSRATLEELGKTLDRTKAELAFLTEALVIFDRGEIPSHIKPELEQAASKAEVSHTSQCNSEKQRLDELVAAQKSANESLSSTLKQIEQSEAMVRRFQEIGKPFKWTLLVVPWRVLVAKFQKDVEKASAKQEGLQRQLEDLKESIRIVTETHAALVGRRGTVITAEVESERARQHESCQDRKRQLLDELSRLEESAAEEQKKLAEFERNQSVLCAERQEAATTTENRERASIKDEIQVSLLAAQNQVSTAESHAQSTAEQVHVNEVAMAALSEQQAATMQQLLKGERERASQATAALNAAQQSISQTATTHDIALSLPITRSSVERVRDTLITEAELLRGTPLGERAQHSPNNANRRPRMAIDTFEDGQAFGGSPASGNLYLDFERNAEDNTGQRGRTFSGLRRQLADLRRKHSDALFPGISLDDDLLNAFQESFFPHGLSQSYVICNLSLQENQPYLAIRPKVIGPRLEQLLPRGITLAVCARLWDTQRDTNNPVLLAQRIVDISHSEIRPFEREVTAFVFHQANAVYPAFQRRENVISTDFVTSLPAISALTKERLQDWRAYLDWKERLIQSNLVGLRYVQVDVEPDGRYRFLVVAQSKDAFERVRRTLRNDELRAFGLRYSLDPWEFEYNEDHRGRDIEVGDFGGVNELTALPNVDVDGIPWNRPFSAYVFFRLSEDSQNDFDNMVEGGRSLDDARAHFRDLLNSSGFLALSVVGDMSLVRRQRRELEMLQQQSGYAPLLSSYLFDIRAANLPSGLIDISDDQWFRRDLNEDQKLAVRKMVSTPDLAMVQGPPGTGKTTMIAEAIWQFVRQEKRVLVVSQANLAVDNALERLAHAPSIRAVRLGRKGERDHPYSQTRVLETYYNSIEQACRQRTLDAWREGDRRSADLSKWLSDADLLANDVSILRQQEIDASSEIEKIRNELAAHTAEIERAQQTERTRSGAAAFLECLDHDSEWKGELPDAFLRTFWEAVAQPLQRLLPVGIQANRIWADVDYGSPSDRSRFAVEILREWRSLEKMVSQLSGDLERLRSSDAETVLATDDVIRLGELNRQLQLAQQAMVDDANMVTEWQRLQREIRELKRRGAGLDRGVYERVFNRTEEGVPAYLAFTAPDAARVQIVERLERAMAAISAAMEDLRLGLARCRAELQTFIEGLVIPSHDTAQTQRIEGRLRDATHRVREVAQQRTSKEARLAEFLKEHASGQPVNTDSAAESFPHFRSVVAEQLQRVQTQLNSTRTFRDAWEPILQQWVTDLSRADTVRNDQVTFLPTYIAACNVVGVTCTENRRTLEDAGHTRFDVVIVDEVSKATPPEIIMPLLMGRTAILVGDHRQLPPLFKEREGSWEEVVASEEENSETGNSVDVASELTAENFERFRKMVTSSLFKEHFENAPDELKSFLFTQYRMHPQIMRVVNQFYENRLICGLPDPDATQASSDPRGHRFHGMTLTGPGKHHYLKPDQHVVWIDSTTDPTRQKHFERRDGTTSKVNDLESILIAKCLLDIEEACRAQGFGQENRKPKQVGVITFYGRQVRAIREAVKRFQKQRKMVFSAIRVDINTVDRYQGQERPIIIVSMVRNPPWRLSRRANTAQFERINVAFSRAQELLIVTGAKDVFCSYPVDLPYLERQGRRKVEVYRYIIDEIQRGGGLWRSEAVIDAQEYARLLPKDQPTRTNSGQRRGRR